MARLEMYGLTMWICSAASSRAVSIASLIGWWPVPGTFHRTVVGAWTAASGATRNVVGREVPLQGGIRRGRPVVVPPAQQEDRLELGDDRPLDPAHDVVEALVVVVVLDAAATDVADPAVDDRHLAMVEVEQVLATRPERAVREVAGPDDGDPVLGHDLDARREQPPEQVLAAEVDLAADGVDRQSDLDAGRDPVGQRGQEGLADVAGLVAVDEQVDVVGRGRDVLQHPREVAPAVEQGVDRGRDRRRIGLGQVDAADPRTADDLGGAGRGRLGPDGVRVEWIGRDPRAAATEHRPGRGQPGTERDRPTSGHRRALRSAVGSGNPVPLVGVPVATRGDPRL